MEISNSGKSPNTSISFRYNANNEELEELSQACDDDPPTPQSDPPPKTENTSPKKTEKSASILDKYFKSMRTEKPTEKVEEKSDTKPEESKTPVPPKEVTSSPMKDYLNRLGKRSNSEVAPETKEANETWKIFHDFKYKIAQAVEDMKTRSVEETKEKALPRENSTSDSEESSAVKDCDQQSVGDTDNQVSSLDSSMQNLSEMTQPLTAKPTELELSCEPSLTKNNSESSDDTHKNIGQFDIDQSPDSIQDNDLEVESGIEALEDTIDAFGDVTQLPESHRGTPIEPKYIPSTPITAPNFDFPLNRSAKVEPVKNRTYFLKFSMYFLTIFLLISYIIFPNANVWNGFLMGVWFIVFTNNLKDWILDTYFTDSDTAKTGFFQVRSTNHLTYTILPSVKEHRPLKKFEGWLNHYRFPDYDPFTYHINKTTTAFVKLEGCNLRISYTRAKIAKRALWDEKIDHVTFYQHRLYNLTGARVILLPKGLVKRRQWSKKYPICIILSEKEKIQVLEKESSTSEKKSELDKKIKEVLPEAEINDVNTSPEKKKKFVWRRREKSIPNSENEPGREGLRHRIARKIHNKDKKTETASTSTEPEQPDRLSQEETMIELDDVTTKSVASKEDEDDIDDSEISRIKEFLDEAEQEEGAESQAEGEWSVHVRPSTDRHARLFLFTRTGRDKHDWYRRLLTAVSEANASAESSAADDNKSVNEETKDGIEMGAYKLAEKDTVSFAKNKNNESSSEGVTINATPTHSSSFESYEKTFLPYLLKVIESECLPPECACRKLAAEVSWLNTLVARVMFDVSRDPYTVARLQAKIQRKLHTLKLPSFMSPLAVTKLTLAGCPIVRRVRAAAADERGLWLHADVSYAGGASITILTQINLMKLKEKSTTLDGQSEESEDEEPQKEVTMSPVKGISTEKQLRKRKPAIFDSDMEDSAESSSDDESPPVQPVDSAENMLPADSASTTGEGSSKKKFLRMVDKIATNKYFQQVTEYKYVKRGMEALSNTDIKLQLELVGLDGTLAINVPPPPHDRIWLGFVTNPQLVLKARPAVGARTLRFAHITNWIEQKLTREFEKVLVIPNMEDFIVDVMTPTPVEFE
ncbi:testis-expressed protein 2 [Aricia agestis]|uniref:testis-expressed protein 2 n=1 Tax=Aricia agestis TaxID=91739 RepID=UPI001C202E77|nr:testis-expressed protein 2 [Aricia agestis]